MIKKLSSPTRLKWSSNRSIRSTWLKDRFGKDLQWKSVRGNITKSLGGKNYYVTCQRAVKHDKTKSIIFFLIIIVTLYSE